MSRVILTVVIASYNSEKYIESCLKSIEHEACDGVEFILVDGASSDKTMQVVERHKHLFRKILSEPDRGQSDAFNKGFRLAKGQYLTWLNSDDVLVRGSMMKALSYLSEAEVDWVTANSVYLNSVGEVTKCCRSGGFESFAVKRGLLNVFGPSTFFSKSLYQKVGDFAEDFHYCMDTEYWWRIVSAGYRYERMPVYFWGLRLHSDAKTANVLLTGEYPARMTQEVKQMSQSYYPKVNPRAAKLGRWMVRGFRLVNLSYLRSFWDTLRFRGTVIE